MNALFKSSHHQSATPELRTCDPSASITLSPSLSIMNLSPELALTFAMTRTFVPRHWTIAFPFASTARLKSVLKFLQHFSPKLKCLTLYQVLTKILPLQAEMLKCSSGHWILTHSIVIPAWTWTSIICLCDFMKVMLSRLAETILKRFNTFQETLKRSSCKSR